MYKKKLLFRNTNGTWSTEATAQESVYAYLYNVSDDKKSTGRYRIRITKMSAAELVSLGMAPEGTPSEFFGLQANLDKWQQEHGWLPLFDWVGDPDATLDKIEKDLNNQFKSFITGISTEENFSFDYPPPPPKAKPIKLPPKDKKQSVDEDIPESTDEASKSDDDPDFEWL